MAAEDYSILEWRLIPDFPDYEVSENGDVRRRTQGVHLSPGSLLKPSPGSGGYPVYSLYRPGYKRTCETHMLVAQAFLGPKPFPDAEVAHWDGIPTHNHYTNLRWATVKENRQDARRHGRGPDGERNAMAKLTWEKVEEIREKFATGLYTQAQLGREYHVTFQAIWSVIHKKNWPD